MTTGGFQFGGPSLSFQKKKQHIYINQTVTGKIHHIKTPSSTSASFGIPLTIDSKKDNSISNKIRTNYSDKKI